MSVDVKAKYSGTEILGTAQLVISKPMSVKFTGQWGATSFLYTQNPKGAIELDRTLGRYREYGRASTILPPTGEVAGPAPTAFPGIVLVQDLRKVIPPGKAYSLAKSTPGVKATTIECEFQVQGGRIHIWFKIDEFGRLIFSKQVRSGERGSESLEIYYSNWKVNKSYSPKFFEIEPPLGTRPDVLPSPPNSLSVGQQFPMGETVKLRTGMQKLSAIAGGKPILVSVLSENCAPSRSFHAWLEKDAPQFTSKVRLLHFVAGAGKPFSGKAPIAKQPSGTLFHKLNLPGTPGLYLIDSKGNIANMWFGFDPAEKAALGKEILFAINVLGSR